MGYKYFGALICCSANGVMRVERVKKWIDELAKMGYNLLELCIDDIYKIEEEPFFGYLRGGYTQQELREMDDYAYARGIELVPCIQTLAHLGNLVKLPHYWDIVDVNDILLIDEPKTYALIEKMFASIRSSFRTKLVNIGMDEAHMVGLGKYLDKHGYENRTQLLLRHLTKVLEIAHKYDFHAHMWSDMFFRLDNKGEYYGEKVSISCETVEKIPKDIALCYWDYGELAANRVFVGDKAAWNEQVFDHMFTEHEKCERKLWFAASVWNYNGFAPQNKMAQCVMKPGFKQAIQHGVENILVTVWGDDGNDSSYFAALPSMYALRQYALGNFDSVSIAEGFYKIFGFQFEDFMLLDIPNYNSGNPEALWRESACKALLYNDCFLGWKDNYIETLQPIPYGEYAKKLQEAGDRVGEYGYIFETLSLLCSALELKATLGVQTRRAYKNGDKATLKVLIDIYAETALRIDVFRRKFREMWLKEYKGNGWEIQQYRLGGLYMRVLDCRERLMEYLDGKIDRIEELEEEILPYGDNGLQHNAFCGLISVSGI